MNSLSPSVAEQLRELNVRNFEGYGPSAIPNKRDQSLRSLVESLATQVGNLEIVLPQFDGIQRAILRAFAERCASQAVRLSDSDQLRLGVLGLALSCNASPEPEEFLVLSLLSDAAMRLGIVDRDFFVSTLSLAGLEVANFAAFADRVPEDKSIDSMGYAFASTSDGLRYVRNW